jgi:protein-L-isoaspartate(D-aspartate) O-methyltransferase
VLRELGAEVFTIECVAALAERARARLAATGYDDIHVRIGDGLDGWPDAAPFAAIIVTAAPRTMPTRLRDQLVDGGRMVVPVGPPHVQELLVVRRRGDRFDAHAIEAVAFVPMQSQATLE